MKPRYPSASGIHRKAPGRLLGQVVGILALSAVCLAAAEPSPAAGFSFLAESKLPVSVSGPASSSASGPGKSRGTDPLPAYSPLHGIYGSLIGTVLGGVVGALAAAPSVNSCKDGETGSETGSFCGLYGVFGVGIGAGIGYSLGVPVGGHFSQGLVTRRFAINLAAITVLTGVLAYTDWTLMEAYGSPSYRITIPLSMAAPHLAAYLIGR